MNLVKVKGHFEHINDVRDAVKLKLPNTLGHVDARDIRVFVSKQDYEAQKGALALAAADTLEEPKGLDPCLGIPPNASNHETPLYLIPPQAGWSSFSMCACLLSA
jgi:hypothetical protein